MDNNGRIQDESKQPPDEQQAWTQDEYERLQNIVLQHSDKKQSDWSFISSKFPNKSAQQVKKMFTSLKKQLLIQNQKTGDETQESNLLSNENQKSPSKRNKSRHQAQEKPEIVQKLNKNIVANCDLQSSQMFDAIAKHTQQNDDMCLSAIKLDSGIKQQMFSQEQQNIFNGVDKMNVLKWKKSMKHQFLVVCQYYNYEWQYIIRNFFSSYTIDELQNVVRQLFQDRDEYAAIMQQFLFWDGKSYIVDVETAKECYNSCASGLFKYQRSKGMNVKEPVLYPNKDSYFQCSCDNPIEMRFLNELAMKYDIEKMFNNVVLYLNSVHCQKQQVQ